MKQPAPCAACRIADAESVVMDLPLSASTGVTQERVGSPFTSTVQAPHWRARSQTVDPHAEVIAQGVKKRHIRFRLDGVPRTIDVELDALGHGVLP